MATCRSCKAEIRWSVTKAGELMPLDPDPNPDGNVVFTGRTAHSKAGHAPEVQVLDSPQMSLLDDPRDHYMPHFATCPQGKEWSRGARPPEAHHHAGGMDTEVEAAHGDRTARDAQRQSVLIALANAGDAGLTDYEAGRVLGVLRTSAGKRRLELMRDDLVADSGQRRPTDTGATAAVWVATEAGRRAAARVLQTTSSS